MSALNIKDEAVADAARELARRRGTTVTRAVGDAVAEALQREKARARPQGLAEDILAIARHCQALPLLDARSEDEILGYGPDGVPT